VAVVTPDVPSTCRVIVIDGQPIRVSDTNGVRGQVITATRFLDGGFVVIVSRHGSLGTPPLVAAQVATVAADPAILP
jgi:hypothetical protein